jgi:hypothetical protein
MKTHYRLWMLIPAASLIALVSNGCYTQFGSTKDDEEAVQYEDEDQYAYDDSVATEDDYANARERFYDENYYPGSAYGWGFYDAGMWGHHNGYLYDPLWGWCGTSYPYYSGWWSDPFYGYYPYPSYGYGHYGGGGFAARPGRQYGSSRNIGSTRSEGGLRGTTFNPGERGSGMGTMPSVGAYRAPRPSGTVTKAPTNRTARVSKPGGSRSSGSDATRSGSQRASSRPASSSRTSSPDKSSRGSNSGGSHEDRSGGSYPPPSSRAPSSTSAPSSPSSGGGSSAPSNSGDRGGNRR